MKSNTLRTLLASLLLPAGSARASIAYGSINNFDTVNDTGVECHGFEIEIEDIHSRDISYTYNYNHYGVPKITEHSIDPLHPRVCIRWESSRKPDGTWAAYTAIPAGPISPTNGHMFTNPSVNFGGEHFGVGYRVPGSAVKYFWLIDDGAGNLTRGPSVNVATPTFTYYPAAAPGVPAQVQAVIQPPPQPPAPEFGKATWVKEIRTTTHNSRKVKLRDLVSDDPDDPDDVNWRNDEPDEVETEWQLLQHDFTKPDGGNNARLEAAPEDLDNGDEVVTRRYEFYEYTGPLNNESKEALADSVDADGIHGVGETTANGQVYDLSIYEVVGEFLGAQMSAVDVDARAGLTEHLQDGRINEAYPERAVIIPGLLPFTATTSGELPAGMTFNEVSGILSGTPTESGVFNWKVTACDTPGQDVQKSYTITIAAEGEELPARSILDTVAEPVGGGSTTGDGAFAVDANATVTATPTAGFIFLNWTDNGEIVSNVASHTLTMNVNHSLVAHFAPTVQQRIITLTAQPVMGGTLAGGGTVDDGSSVTVTASAAAGYSFMIWTESGAVVSAAASFTFSATADRTLTANFTAAGDRRTVTTGSTPAAGGTTSGGGQYVAGSSCTVSAVPGEGYMFKRWLEDNSNRSTSADYTFTVSNNIALTAKFVIAARINTSASPAHAGTTSGAGLYEDGDDVTVTATPAAGAC